MRHVHQLGTSLQDSETLHIEISLLTGMRSMMPMISFPTQEKAIVLQKSNRNQPKTNRHRRFRLSSFSPSGEEGHDPTPADAQSSQSASIIHSYNVFTYITGYCWSFHRSPLHLYNRRPSTNGSANDTTNVGSDCYSSRTFAGQ